MGKWYTYKLFDNTELEVDDDNDEVLLCIKGSTHRAYVHLAVDKHHGNPIREREAGPTCDTKCGKAIENTTAYVYSETTKTLLM